MARLLASMALLHAIVYGRNRSISTQKQSANVYLGGNVNHAPIFWCTHPCSGLCLAWTISTDKELLFYEMSIYAKTVIILCLAIP